MAISVDDNVIRFQISEYDLPLMQILNGKNNLSQVYPDNILFKLAFPLNHLAEVAPSTVLEQQVKLILGLKSVIQLDDERVVSVREHIPLG